MQKNVANLDFTLNYLFLDRNNLKWESDISVIIIY